MVVINKIVLIVMVYLDGSSYYWIDLNIWIWNWETENPSHCWYGFAWLLNLPVYYMFCPCLLENLSLKKQKNICAHILLPLAPKCYGFIPNPCGLEPGNQNGAGSCGGIESWKQIKLPMVGVPLGLNCKLWMYSMGFVLCTLLLLNCFLFSYLRKCCTTV